MNHKHTRGFYRDPALPEPLSARLAYPNSHKITSNILMRTQNFSSVFSITTILDNEGHLYTVYYIITVAAAQNSD